MEIVKSKEVRADRERENSARDMNWMNQRRDNCNRLPYRGNHQLKWLFNGHETWNSLLSINLYCVLWILDYDWIICIRIWTAYMLDLVSISRFLRLNANYSIGLYESVATYTYTSHITHTYVCPCEHTHAHTNTHRYNLGRSYSSIIGHTQMCGLRATHIPAKNMHFANLAICFNSLTKRISESITQSQTLKLPLMLLDFVQRPWFKCILPNFIIRYIE